jgi:hypothetical protein
LESAWDGGWRYYRYRSTGGTGSSSGGNYATSGKDHGHRGSVDAVLMMSVVVSVDKTTRVAT